MVLGGGAVAYERGPLYMAPMASIRGTHVQQKPQNSWCTPSILNPKPETRYPKPEKRNPKPEKRNPKPDTRYPKNETRNPHPLKPKPGSTRRHGRIFLEDFWELLEVNHQIRSQETRQKSLIGAIPGHNNVSFVTGGTFKGGGISLRFWFVTWFGNPIPSTHASF